jgi:hypothetical protein
MFEYQDARDVLLHLIEDHHAAQAPHHRHRSWDQPGHDVLPDALSHEPERHADGLDDGTRRKPRMQYWIDRARLGEPIEGEVGAHGL